MTTRFTRVAGVAVAFGLAAALTACGSDSSDSGSTSDDTAAASGGAKKIALLLPENKTARYEAFDRPFFEEAVKAACSDCEVIYSNAEQDAAKQQQQAEAAITQGVDVLVMSAVDGKSAATIVNNAKAQGVPVVAYDRFIAGADYYVSFDNKRVGELQGQGLIEAMKAAGNDSGDIVMINGAPTDANAADFKAGAHSVIDSSGYTVAAEYDTPDWSPDKAQTWMEGQVGTLKGDLVGVYAANDGTAGGAIAALKAGGVEPAAAGDRAGRRARRDPADHRRRPGADHLQGDQAAGRGRRQGRSRAGERRRAGVVRRQGGRPRDAAGPGGRDQGQHHGHRGRRRLLHRRGHLHPRVRGRLHGARDQLTPCTQSPHEGVSRP